jgi:hypothetical protein
MRNCKINQDAYNDWFVSMITKHRPLWVNKVRYRQYDDINYVCVVIEDEGSKHGNIELSADRTELTIFYHEWHFHTDMFEEADHENELLETLEFIDDIINEEIVIITEYNNGNMQSTQSSHFSSVEIDETKEISIVSYNGKYDSYYNMSDK